MSVPAIEAAIARADRSLFALAHLLRRVPVHPASKHLHVRALELKRQLREWRLDPPPLATVAAVQEEIDELRAEASVHASAVSARAARALVSAGAARPMA